VLRGLAAHQSAAKGQHTHSKRQDSLPLGNRILARPKIFLRNVLGTIVYWIGWGFAVLVLVQAIILAVISGNPFVPLLLGAVGLIVWLIAIGFKYAMAR
jgi:hypothetical protein